MIEHLIKHEHEDFARKVSAVTLRDPIPPKNLHHHNNMQESDKEIWDMSYAEEYFGLHTDTKTWEYISEEEYELFKPVIGQALPTFALAT
eukprot:567798-Ditylum_brightwellii.AAC.1